MHSCIIGRPTFGPNLKGKLKFTCIVRTHTFMVQRSDHKRVRDFISRSLIMWHSRDHSGGRRD